jgi:outer membrane receptor for ferric coprogen and ferric-rhodotorulic acid
MILIYTTCIMNTVALVSTSLLVLSPLAAHAEDTATLDTVSVSASTDTQNTHSYQTRQTSVATRKARWTRPRPHSPSPRKPWPTNR